MYEYNLQMYHKYTYQRVKTGYSSLLSVHSVINLDLLPGDERNSHMSIDDKGMPLMALSQQDDDCFLLLK